MRCRLISAFTKREDYSGRDGSPQGAILREGIVESARPFRKTAPVSDAKKSREMKQQKSIELNSKRASP